MGRGPTRSEATAIRYRMLKKAERKLRDAGVPVHYVKGGKNVRQCLAFGPVEGMKEGAFHINVQSLHASNGEAAFYLAGFYEDKHGDRQEVDSFLANPGIVERVIEVYSQTNVVI